MTYFGERVRVEDDLCQIVYKGTILYHGSCKRISKFNKLLYISPHKDISRKYIMLLNRAYQYVTGKTTKRQCFLYTFRAKQNIVVIRKPFDRGYETATAFDARGPGAFPTHQTFCASVQRRKPVVHEHDSESVLKRWSDGTWLNLTRGTVITAVAPRREGPWHAPHRAEDIKWVKEHPAISGWITNREVAPLFRFCERSVPYTDKQLKAEIKQLERGNVTHFARVYTRDHANVWKSTMPSSQKPIEVIKTSEIVLCNPEDHLELMGTEEIDGRIILGEMMRDIASIFKKWVGIEDQKMREDIAREELTRMVTATVLED